jgi:hypothetical protein
MELPEPLFFAGATTRLEGGRALSSGRGCVVGGIEELASICWKVVEVSQATQQVLWVNCGSRGKSG